MLAFFICLISLLISNLKAQDITGDWNGVLEMMGTQVTLVFHIQHSDSGYIGTLDSPDQGAMGMPFTAVEYNNNKLILREANIGAFYEGKPAADSIVGTWNQGGQTFELNMYREKVEKKTYNRPQEPEKPYPYYEEEVVFENSRDSLTLAGTLTLPEESGSFSAVILISGSGPQDRNEEVFGHRPFLVLADYLTRQGIAVLRYDDRGTAESTGDFASATSQDFANDVLSAIDYLKGRDEIDESRIGLIGHSEGGLIAPIVVNRSDDVDFMILLAGTGVPGKEISRMQGRTLMDIEVSDREAYNLFIDATIEIASSNKPTNIKKKQLTQHYKNSQKVINELMPEGLDFDFFIEQQVEGSLRPWSQFFFNHDPADELSKITIPVLSLIGSNDVQVPAEMNHPPIQKALHEAGNEDVVIKELDGLNHMFQESETGSISEYAEIEQTFSPIALEEISCWIRNRVEQ
ncbi:MAG: alpha/beta fold hydrolase [Bacteroidetes bacterium]|nr:alpha/beta fold hydrolase [Bacteroidota bacterium]